MDEIKRFQIPLILKYYPVEIINAYFKINVFHDHVDVNKNLDIFSTPPYFVFLLLTSMVSNSLPSISITCRIAFFSFTSIFMKCSIFL
ncbi:hypothetical protein LCGC14_0292870 [marine sediment metagenome]|uniref:Uncharacterized protein n=1 Tax=marine sediment metagenome TaxID=412755 RepID=A0A0F9TSQ6_9ZZZZ